MTEKSFAAGAITSKLKDFEGVHILAYKNQLHFGVN
jgi:hypothetical protein